MTDVMITRVRALLDLGSRTIGYLACACTLACGTSQPAGSPPAAPPQPVPSAGSSSPAPADPACGMHPDDWCPAPAGDPCGAHKDVASCRADPKCGGMPYRGESVVACTLDDRGFASNCPTVGCVTRAK